MAFNHLEGMMPITPPKGLRIREDMPTFETLYELHGHLELHAKELLDVQKLRIASGLRVGALERAGKSDDVIESASFTPLALEEIERAIDARLVYLVRLHPLAPWIEEQRGIGYPGFGRLFGATGPLSRYPMVSSLWKYCGLHVTPEGTAAKRQKGVNLTHTDCQFKHLRTCKSDCKTEHHPSCVPNSIGTAWAPQARVICHQLGESIVKAGSGPYREAYDYKKAQYLARPRYGPSGCPMGQEHKSKAGKPIACVKVTDGVETSAHLHNAAMRYAVKELLKAMWIAWRQYVPAEMEQTA